MIIYLIILLQFLSAVTFANNPTPEMEIDDILDQLVLAYNDLDEKKIKSLIKDDEFTKIIHEGIIYSDLYADINNEKVAEQNMKITYAWNDKDIRIVDGISAVAVCEMLATTTQKDKKPFQTRTVDTIVLEKVKGKWLIITMHSSGKRTDRNF